MSKSFLIASSEEEFTDQEILKLLKNLNVAENSVDFMLIEQSSEKLSIGIEVTRELKKWLSVKPFNSENKLAVIKRADLLTIEAQNSILKQLEEPNPNHYIALVLENPQSLLPTVLSRCEVISDRSYKQKSEFTEFTILSKTEQFKYVENLLKISDTSVLNQNIKNFLKELLLFFEKELLNTPFDKKIRDDIALVEQTSIMINANVPKRLALENLLINMKS